MAFVASMSMSSSSGGGNAPKGYRRFVNFTGFPFPLGPALERATLRRELIPGVMWSFEQEQGLSGSTVSTNVRMTAVKMKNGSLWIHAPIAPTEECIDLVNELECPVDWIVNPTYAYEHKVFVPSFARRYPQAKLFSVRGWSWPLPLPDPFLGLKVEAYLDDREKVPWADEIDFRVLGSSSLGIAPFTEAAFFHWSSRTLITTDTFIQVPSVPPAVISSTKLTKLGNPDSVLASFVPGGYEAPPRDLPENILGWMRMSTLALFLGPVSLLDPRESFESIRGRLTISPVLRVLVFGKIRSVFRLWTSEILEWPFERIVPAHFDAPIRAGPPEARRALSCVLDEEGDGIRDSDLKNLRNINGFLRALRIVKAEESF